MSALNPNGGSLGIGTSYSHRHAAFLGLDPVQAFEQILRMDFDLVRVSAYWDEIAIQGFGMLDMVLEAAERADQALLLTVGMKGMRWPEFHLPPVLERLSTNDLRGPVLELVARTVDHCRQSDAIVGWQVENEPLNRSGPARRWIPLDLLAAETAVVRSLDSRPVVLNAFRHFTLISALVSQPWPWTHVERLLLGLLKPGDVLGLDVYTHIGWSLAGFNGASHARSDWLGEAASLARAAQAMRTHPWVTESQAEPWRSGDFLPIDIGRNYRGLAGCGFERILLWGAEHWLYRQGLGDLSWLRQVQAILGSRT